MTWEWTPGRRNNELYWRARTMAAAGDEAGLRILWASAIANGMDENEVRRTILAARRPGLLPKLRLRDGSGCGLCGKPLPAKDGRDIHMDHIVPVSRGGGDDMANLRLVHDKCNLKRGNKT